MLPQSHRIALSLLAIDQIAIQLDMSCQPAPPGLHLNLGSICATCLQFMTRDATSLSVAASQRMVISSQHAYALL